MTFTDLFVRFQKYLVIIGGVYVGVVALLCTPFFQRHMLYLNAVRLPLLAKFDSPESYNLAPNKTFNFHMKTPDNESIGGWFVLSESYYRGLPSVPANVEEHVSPALKSRPTVLFLHGNAATRAFHVRVAQYQAISARLNANVLAIDYRGFADSTGIPSEQGLVTDARAAFDWLVKQGARGEDVLLYGHSLGTGVSSQLSAQLSQEGVPYKGVVLLAPFSSIRTLLDNYHLFGFVPLLQPVSILPRVTNLVTWALTHKFDSLGAVPNITSDVLIVHAENDWEIPSSHSDVLFQAFLTPYLPEAPEIPFGPGTFLSPEEWSAIGERAKKRQELLDSAVKTTHIARFGQVQEFTKDGRTVVLLKTLIGSHDYVGLQEGVHDLVRSTFNF